MSKTIVMTQPLATNVAPDTLVVTVQFKGYSQYFMVSDCEPKSAQLKEALKILKKVYKSIENKK